MLLDSARAAFPLLTFLILQFQFLYFLSLHFHVTSISCHFTFPVLRSQMRCAIRGIAQFCSKSNNITSI